MCLFQQLNLTGVSVDASGVESCVVDDRSGLVVLHPDNLLSGTSIVSSLFCMRKAVLNERFKGLEGKSYLLCYCNVLITAGEKFFLLIGLGCCFCSYN